MSITVACACGKSYDLKDEFEGRMVKCPACGATMRAERTAPLAQADPAFDRDKFLLRQKHLAINEKYYVWDEAGKTILFIERPSHLLQSIGAILLAIFILLVGIGLAVWIATSLRVHALQIVASLVIVVLGVVGALVVGIALMPKRHVTFYRDDTRNERLLKIHQDQKISLINTTYSILDAADQPLGQLRKNNLYNFFRKRWYCSDADGRKLCLAMEDSMILSLLRRFLGTFFGLLRTNFIIVAPDGEHQFGTFNRNFTLLDRYVLDLSPDAGRSLDRRIVLALGVMLDTGEKR